MDDYAQQIRREFLDRQRPHGRLALLFFFVVALLVGGFLDGLSQEERNPVIYISQE